MTTTSGGPPGRRRPGASDPAPAPEPGGRAAARHGAAQRRAAVQEQVKRRRQIQRLGLIAAVALVLAAGLALVSNLAAGGSKVNDPRPYAVDGKTKGDPNAPVTVTSWDDFQ